MGSLVKSGKSALTPLPFRATRLAAQSRLPQTPYPLEQLLVCAGPVLLFVHSLKPHLYVRFRHSACQPDNRWGT